MSWLRYEKKTTLPDGTIRTESGPTVLGSFVEWVQICFTLFGSLLFWLSFPIAYPLMLLFDRRPSWTRSKTSNLQDFQVDDGAPDGAPVAMIEDAPWNQEDAPSSELEPLLPKEYIPPPNQTPMSHAMDLLTMGYRTWEEVDELLGEGTAKWAAELLDDEYGYDHYPWYAKPWRPLDEIALQRCHEPIKKKYQKLEAEKMEAFAKKNSHLPEDLEQQMQKIDDFLDSKQKKEDK